MKCPAFTLTSPVSPSGKAIGGRGKVPQTEPLGDLSHLEKGRIKWTLKDLCNPPFEALCPICPSFSNVQMHYFKLCIATTRPYSALSPTHYSQFCIPLYFFFFSSSNLLLRSSKSTSSPPAELDPTVLSKGGKLAAGTDGNSGSPSTGEGPCGPGGGGVGIPPPGCWGYGVLLYWGGSVDGWREKITVCFRARKEKVCLTNPRA